MESQIAFYSVMSIVLFIVGAVSSVSSFIFLVEHFKANAWTSSRITGFVGWVLINIGVLFAAYQYNSAYKTMQNEFIITTFVDKLIFIDDNNCSGPIVHVESRDDFISSRSQLIIEHMKSKRWKLVMIKDNKSWWEKIMEDDKSTKLRDTLK